MEREPRRDRDLQDYTDRFGRGYEPRLSRADEQRFADDAEAKREERDRAELAELERRIEHAVRAVDHVRQLIPPGRRGTERAIVHHMGQARRLLESLRRPDAPADDR
jgi:Xaa-Pro aminopeptidase